MTDPEVIEMLARFYGWKAPDNCAFKEAHPWMSPDDGCCYDKLPNFLESRDALQPILDRLNETKNKELLTNLALRFGSGSFGAYHWFLLTIRPAPLARAIAAILKKQK